MSKGKVYIQWMSTQAVNNKTEVIKNVKNLENAKKILKKRNSNSILSAHFFNNEGTINLLLTKNK